MDEYHAIPRTPYYVLLSGLVLLGGWNPYIARELRIHVMSDGPLAGLGYWGR